jgi:hypothetical protein
LKKKFEQNWDECEKNGSCPLECKEYLKKKNGETELEETQ